VGLALAAQKVITALRPQAEPRRRLERLLVVDDERMACNLISLRLRQSGFQVETAHTAAEALETINTRKFDLVLLDRLMPGWNGDRVLKELRQAHSASELPVIMVSAIDDSDQIAEALEMGANDYITKPIDFTIAVARIRSQLTRSHPEGIGRPTDHSFDTRGDGLWDWNLETDQIYYCPRWVAMLGLAPQEVSSDPAVWLSRVHSQDIGPLRLALQDHRNGKTPSFEVEYRIRCKDGAFRWMTSRGVAFRDTNGKAVRMAGSQADITAAKTIDSLTGLPNRVLFMERLTAAMEQNCLNPGHGIAVLMVNVDRFKLVNQTLGHSAGDNLLIEFASRIRSVLVKWRSAAEDREGSVVARLGSDQFAALIEGISSPLQAVSIADQMLQAIRPMLTLASETGEEDRSFRCTASIGVALSGTLSRPRFQTANEILEDANAAMLSAKARDKDCWALFSDSMHDRAAADRIAENELRDALQLGQLQVLYQPRVDLTTEKILGFEALVRWNHPHRGLVLPADFIPFAEQTGVIREIGLWVMEEACSQIKQWQCRFSSTPPLDVAVNVSPVQLREPDFVGRVLQILNRTGLPPSSLQLELTESVPVLDMEGARRKLCELKEIGVGLKMDDFATGYSSLRYLSKLPFDSVKIDRSFIGDLDDENGVTKEIVRTILGMAASLKIGVIAEGIEQPEHLKCLRELGCQFGQGFYFSEPVDVAGIEKLLLANTPQSE
jgi:diguanylate cyclase (GGDEF)-like protein/PAS domain S-box-containing protein